MKLRTIVKIAITSSVVLLCAGFALYSFFRLSAAEGKKDFNLYELVPPSASAVFVTDDILEFVAEVDDLACSKNQQYLHVSKLFSYLKQYLYTLQEEAPHGLSRQMNQMLISFHEPDNIHNQVLYCRLGEGDRQLIDRFVQKYVSSLYPPKTFKYKGEDITIYPMADGDFLACYLTSFMNVLRQQESVEGFPGEALPSTAFYFTKQGVTDWASLLSYGDMQETGVRTSDVRNRNRELSHYLMENAGQELVACLFQREDTLQEAAAVLSLSVSDVTEAERMLRSLINTVSAEERGKTPLITFCYTANKAYPVYRLPQTTLFTQLTGFAEPTSHTYATFYEGRLLLAPDENSLSRYIRQLDKGEVLNGAIAYRTGMDNLSDSYHFMLMADFDHLFHQAAKQIHFVPDFFLRNSEFFRNFILFAQFTCADGVVYPNIVLRYKSE